MPAAALETQPPPAARRAPPRRVALIGYGAMGRDVHRLLQAHAGAAVDLVAVLERPGYAPPAGAPPLAASVGELLATAPDLIVECAGHAALHAAAAPILRAGTGLLVASVGALADEALEQSLRRAAREGGASLRIPAGALGGFDVLGAARLAGLDSVCYRSFKAPAAWRGTPAESMVDLDAVRDCTEFFSGDARQAATLFPQNANVAAAVALAGLGFARTQVRLAVQPGASGNRHRIEARGRFGEIDVAVLGHTLPANPKTSQLAPLSVVHSVLSDTHAIVVR